MKMPLVSNLPCGSADFQTRAETQTTGPIGPSSSTADGGQRGNRTPTAKGG